MYIYKYLKDNKVVYVGQTDNIDRRYKEHLSDDYAQNAKMQYTELDYTNKEITLIEHMLIARYDVTLANKDRQITPDFLNLFANSNALETLRWHVYIDPNIKKKAEIVRKKILDVAEYELDNQQLALMATFINDNDTDTIMHHYMDIVLKNMSSRNQTEPESDLYYYINKGEIDNFADFTKTINTIRVTNGKEEVGHDTIRQFYGRNPEMPIIDLANKYISM